MTPSQRIALNTFATYGRSLFAAGLALFSTRWVLAALGQSDYGLLAVVGSIITIISFLNSVMAGSAARYLAYSIGEGDSEKVSQWFNAIFSIHLVLPFVLIIIGWPIGEYCIDHVLTIPQDRIVIAHKVFRISLISAFIGMVSIPFNSMFVAKQDIVSLALWSALQSILSFVLAFMLIRMSGDHLLIYATGVVIITVITQLGLSIQAYMVYPECRITYSQWFNIVRLKKILSFAAWNLFGSFGAILRNQGTAVLLNVIFGPKANASFGIANSVSTQVMSLSTAMTGAFSPEITAIEGRGDRKYMLEMALRMCKLSTLLVLIFSVPLIVEVEYVMKLWLHDVPQYADALCKLMLIMFLIDQLSVGYTSAINALGKISAYQATLGTVLISTLPIVWVILKLGSPPTGVGLAFVFTMVVVSLGRVYWGRKLLKMKVGGWIVEVVYPCVFLGIISYMLSIFTKSFMTASIFRFCAVSLVSVVCTALGGWFIVLNAKEKSFLIGSIGRVCHYFRWNGIYQHKEGRLKDCG